MANRRPCHDIDALFSRPRRCLPVLITAIMMLVASGALAQEPQPKRGGMLEFAVSVEPTNYDCHANDAFSFIHPVIPHYSTLLKFDAAHYPQIVGDLAESWTVSPDRLIYTFKLRPNVLFHDGSKMTSADVKASYERIVRPPPGVFSSRLVNHGAISSIETPDPLTVIFRLQWPEAAMLANFASPWNCIYSAAKLAEDPQYPKTHILGTGPFVFVEHVKGQHWLAKRWDKYFRPGRPLLDGYQVDFMPPAAVLPAYKSGQIMAEFRGLTPPQANELTQAMGDRITLSDSPWVAALTIVFNTQHPPFDDARVRRALSLAIDRWGAADKLGSTTFLKYVGGLMRPGSNMATPESELIDLPGFSHDIAASRAEAKRLLAEAGVQDLKLTLAAPAIPMPFFIGQDLASDSWHELGITTVEEKFPLSEFRGAITDGKFDAAIDFAGDFFDDPTIQLTRFVSPDLSPVNFSHATDRFLDALFIGQALTIDLQARVKIVRGFEQHAMTDAYTVPLLWWSRIVATSSKLKGWSITPSHFIGQDLTDVWLDQ